MGMGLKPEERQPSNLCSGISQIRLPLQTERETMKIKTTIPGTESKMSAKQQSDHIVIESKQR